MTELRNEQVRRFLIDHIEDHPRDIVSRAVEEFGITRQAVHRHLAKLVKDRVVEAKGTTRNKEYSLALTGFESELLLAVNSDEDQAWRVHVASRLNGLPENTLNICHYGFTEIFNNAIDHSEGTQARVGVYRSAKKVSLFVGDHGVGIFEKIKRRFDLEDRRLAILELSKGKLTTDPARHSGQGIFFSSRMFDFFTIESGGLRFLHSRHEDRWLIDSGPGDLPGTSVIMSIAVDSKLTPKVIFDQFTDLRYGRL